MRHDPIDSDPKAALHRDHQCPTCDGNVVGIVTIGPGTHHAVPCGHGLPPRSHRGYVETDRDGTNRDRSIDAQSTARLAEESIDG